MKKVIYLTLGSFFLFTGYSCNEEKITNKSVVIKNRVNDEQNIAWAGIVESSTTVSRPAYYEDSYWEEINKDVNYNAIFNTIINAVLNGEKQAYDIMWNEPISISEVEMMMGLSDKSKKEGGVEITIDDVSTLRMRESWSFNEDSFELTKKVYRIDILLKRIDAKTGELLGGDSPLFYILLD